MQASVPVSSCRLPACTGVLLAECPAAETARVAVSRARAGVTVQGKFPEAARQEESNGRGSDKMQHQPPGLSERFDQQAGRDVCDNDHRNDPAEDQAE